MNADQLLKRYTAEIDEVICDGAKQTAQQLLDAGADVDDLPRLMQPFVQWLAQMRARAVARLHANVARLRVVEAQIERLESQATVH
jgi:hypothetical protein